MGLAAGLVGVALRAAVSTVAGPLVDRVLGEERGGEGPATGNNKKAPAVQETGTRYDSAVCTRACGGRGAPGGFASVLPREGVLGCGADRCPRQGPAWSAS